jgi:hypothetical protein
MICSESQTAISESFIVGDGAKVKFCCALATLTPKLMILNKTIVPIDGEVSIKSYLCTSFSSFFSVSKPMPTWR